MNRTSLRFALLIIVFGYFEIPAQAQGGRGIVLPTCSSALQHRDCEIVIDRDRPATPGLIQVWNSTGVVVHLTNAKPFERCSVTVADSSRSAPDPFLNAMSQLDVGITLLQSRLNDTVIPGQRSNAGGNLETLRIAEQYRAAGRETADFLNTDYVSTPQFSVTTNGGNRRARDIRQFPNDRMHVIAVLRLLDAKAFPISTDQSQEGGMVRTLSEARNEYAKVLSFLLTLPDTFPDQRFALLGGDNVTTSQRFACINSRTSELAVTIPIEVTYRDLQRAVLSAGLFVSTVQSRSIKTASLASGQGTEYVISEDRVAPQVIPFLFVNIRGFQRTYRHRTFTVNFSPGVGLNPNPPGVRAEFAAGGAISVGNVYFLAGIHFSNVPSVGGGYRVGEIVPQGFVPPIGHGWSTGILLGVSYRIPTR